MNPKFQWLLLIPFLLFANGQAAEESGDPFAAYLDGKAPAILREVPVPKVPPENVNVRGVVFGSRDGSEIFAVIATPKAPGKHPGILVLHGGGGSAEIDKAIAWAQRGYVAVAPDLPGIAQPAKLTVSKGKWSDLKYGEDRWVAEPDAGASVIFDAVLSAMKSLYLLRAQPDVDTSRIGVVGVSWGGYMTTMVCGLAGDDVRAGFALYGTGFFDRGSAQGTEPYNPKLPRSSLRRMPPEERERWLKTLDAGRRAPDIKASFFLAAAANDFFGWPRAAQATLDAIPGAKNHVFAPNADHRIPLPGGTVFAKQQPEPFKPTAFQPYPTPSGNKANWVAMEVPYFDYHLKGLGKPFPKVSVQPAKDPLVARFRIDAPYPLTKTEVYWARATPAILKSDDVKSRKWIALPAVKTSDAAYEAKLPAEADEWFAVISDSRPVSVSSDMIRVDAP